MRRRVPLMVAAGCVCLLGALWLAWQGSLAATPPEAGTHNTAPAPSPLEVEGRLVPVQWVRLAFPSSGPVDEILVKEGDIVTAGTVLARQGDHGKYEAQVAAAELERLLASQAIDDLYQKAGEDLALAEKRVAEAQKQREAAQWKVKRLKKPVPQLHIDQAYANMRIAEEQLQQARKDLNKAEIQLKKKGDVIFWMFVKRHDYKILVNRLQKGLALAERRYQDAVDKYDDLIAPVDEIDLAQAEAELAVANAQVQQATRERDARLNGPDLDDLALAKARLQKAETALAAARAASADLELVAPISGQVVDVMVKSGEWAMTGQPVVVLADLSKWEVETTDLTEAEVPDIQPGQKVQVSFDALPGVELRGTVESTGILYEEQHGDVTYTTKVALTQGDPRLRWGMTAQVRFEAP